VLAARRLERLQALAAEIEAGPGGAQALPLATDLSQQSDRERLIGATVARFGRVDVLLNNAGFGRLDWLEKLDPVEDIESQLAVDVAGVIQTTRQVLPLMLAQRSGHIINMASMAGMIATPTYSVYAAGKFAVRGFSEALRREVRPFGVYVSAVFPGGVDTEFAAHAHINRNTPTATPAWLRLSAEQVAAAVVGLVRRPRATLIVPRVMALAALANALLPGVVDWAIVRRFTLPERTAELK
jgi:short-subunit dehydrogenase